MHFRSYTIHRKGGRRDGDHLQAIRASLCPSGTRGKVGGGRIHRVGAGPAKPCLRCDGADGTPPAEGTVKSAQPREEAGTLAGGVRATARAARAVRAGGAEGSQGPHAARSAGGGGVEVARAVGGGQTRGEDAVDP